MKDNKCKWFINGKCYWMGIAETCDGEDECGQYEERIKVRETEKVTNSGKPAELPFNACAPAPINPDTGMHKDYWVLTEEERGKGFRRPVRYGYLHEKCGATTRMATAIAETYARDPGFYGATFCCYCKDHFPVGKYGEFVWEGTNEKVGV